MAGSCEHGTEPSCSLKAENFWLPEELLAFQIGLCTMKVAGVKSNVDVVDHSKIY
jgi:hypothetical protein